MDIRDLTQDELYALAIECDVEGNYEHERTCLNCKAWALWNDRADRLR